MMQYRTHDDGPLTTIHTTRLTHSTGTLGPTAPLSWSGYIFWPSAAAGAATVSEPPGAVRSHTGGAVTVCRFIPTVANPALDAFYSDFSGGVLSGLIAKRG